MDYYITNSEDTLNTIAERFGISPLVLKSINNLESDPLPGTKLLVSYQELSLINEVFYSTRLGKVRGTLTITEHTIVFDPFTVLNSCEVITTIGIEKKDASLFQAYIDLNDVISCNIIELQGNQGSRGSDQIFYIELTLSRIGCEQRGVRSHIPKANVYFKLSTRNIHGESFQYLHLKTKADQILALVNSSLQQIDSNRADSGTFVPFYELNKGYAGKVINGLEIEDDDEEFKLCLAEIRNEELRNHENFTLPIMSTQSHFLAPKMISQILARIPSVFQYRN